MILECFVCDLLQVQVKWRSPIQMRDGFVSVGCTLVQQWRVRLIVMEILDLVNKFEVEFHSGDSGGRFLSERK
jgi:hypothetical protein